MFENMDKIDDIKQIIFYKDEDNQKKVRILYENTDEVNEISFSSGIKLCEEVAKRKNIQTKDGFRKLLNRGFIKVIEKDKIDEIAPKKDTLKEVKKPDNLNEHPEDDYIYSETYQTHQSSKNLNKIRNILIAATAITLVAGIVTYVFSNKKSPSGRMNGATNDTSVTEINPETENQENENEREFKELIDRTTDEKQKNSMINSFEAIKGYNFYFANAYIEEDKNIKPALTYDEITSLQLAYNDYSKEDIKKIYNGAELDAVKLNNDYKTASLQLMAAYAIETKENPLDISPLIESEEGKAFYKKYQDLFMNAKYTTGKEQIKAVEEFYKAVKEDFPITTKERTEGIAHSDNYNTIKSYKLAVTPIIAAAEMMFQNLEIDKTLDNEEIDFLNDIGLCNYAQNKFNKAETILLSSNIDNKNPSYETYKNIIIKIMKNNNGYVIDDKHRDLSKLDTFKLAISGKFDEVINGNFKCTVVQTYSESSTSYREEIKTRSLPITDEAKQEIDAGINAENEAAKKQGQQAAENNRKQIQENENKNAERIKSEVESDNKDMQKKIDNANKSSEPVNESDFGNHKVDFDDNHSDSNGNLDNSVSNITTDGNGDQSNEAFPDPNETGKKFDTASTGVEQEETAGYQYKK